MAHYANHSFQIQVNAPLPPGTQVAVGLTPLPLLQVGVNIPVEISTASAFRQPPTPAPLKTLVMRAHFDTGASRSSIDDGLAQHLGLTPVGVGQSRTAGGMITTNNYAVDLSF